MQFDGDVLARQCRHLDEKFVGEDGDVGALETGNLRAAEEYFVDAATVDLADVAGNVRDGLALTVTDTAVVDCTPPTITRTAASTARRICSGAWAF